MNYVATPPDTLRGATIVSTTVWGMQAREFQVGANPLSVAWPTANQAFYIPFTVSQTTTIPEVFFVAGTGPGTTNFDIGIYRDDFTLIRALGATASVNTTDAILPAGGGALSAPAVLDRGRYYMAMSSAATTLTCRAGVWGNQWMRAIGMQTQASAHPLPATATPASMGTTAFMPMIGLATITNIL